jgi:hypothetical protein
MLQKNAPHESTKTVRGPVSPFSLDLTALSQHPETSELLPPARSTLLHEQLQTNNQELKNQSILPSLQDMFPNMYEQKLPKSSGLLQQSDRSAFHRPHSPTEQYRHDKMVTDVQRHSFPPTFSPAPPSLEERSEKLPTYNEIRNSIQNLPRQPLYEAPPPAPPQVRRFSESSIKKVTILPSSPPPAQNSTPRIKYQDLISYNDKFFVDSYDKNKKRLRETSSTYRNKISLFDVEHPPLSSASLESMAAVISEQLSPQRRRIERQDDVNKTVS